MSGQYISELERHLKEGKFVYTGELEPEKTTDISETIEMARELKGYVVACNVTDNPRACAYISSVVASYLIQKEAGMEVIFQLTCRDRNRLALTSELLGAYALGIRNVLALTGDHTTLGDNPQAKPVFDLDSAQLIYMIRKMVDEKTDLAGNPIHHPPKFIVGGVANPNAEPLEAEILKFARKVKAGMQFCQTQVTFDIEKTKAFLKEVERFEVPVILGIFPLKSYGIAEFFDKNVPGCAVPRHLLESLKEIDKEIADKQKRKQKIDELNIEFFGEFCRELRRTTKLAGLHVMAVGYTRIIPPLIEVIGR